MIQSPIVAMQRKHRTNLPRVDEHFDEETCGGPANDNFGAATGVATTVLAYINDPSAGSPTETLLRLLLPLNHQVRSTSASQM